jgi:hypothetical protein
VNNFNGFMPTPRKRKQNSRTKNADSMTVGVHVPEKKYIDFLDQRAAEQYRSRSEYFFLYLRAEYERFANQAEKVN